MLRRIAFAAVASVFLLVGGCVGALEYRDKVHYAELRARENAEAIAAVTALGLRAEAQFKQKGTVPTSEELNCWRQPCDGPYFVLDQVRVDEQGVVHATHHKPGVPFTPTSQFKITWNSRERSTDRELLTSPWVWRALFVPWLALSLGIAAIPWSGRIVRWLRARIARPD